MASKAERGTKRTCQNPECEERFYDLNRSPIVCPICSAKYTIASAPDVVATSAVEDPIVQRSKAKKPVPVAADDGEVVEVVDGEEALADVEVAEEAAAGEDDETFLQEEEEEGGDMSNIIGGPVAEGDEEP